MERIKLKKNSSEQLDIIANLLFCGKVIVCPTDTIYGLSCLAKNEKAIKKIKTIKKRGEKPFIFLVNSLKMAKKYCYINKKQEQYLGKVWPGPITVILKKKEILSVEASSGLTTIGMRWPKNDFLNLLISLVNQPIVSTSLNISGRESLASLDEIELYFKHRLPDLVIDGGEAKRSKPSKIVDATDMENIRVIRK
jgi:L-threonylcarbamoyladenylate synthase